LVTRRAFELWLERLLIHIADCDDDLSAAEKAIAASAFKLFRRPDGTWVLAGQLDDERGMVVKDIIERRAAQIARQRPPGQRSVTDNDRAAALVDLVTRRTGGAGGSGPALALPEPSAGSGVEVLQWPGGPSGDGGATPCCADDLAAPVRMGVGVIVDAQTLLHGPHADSVAENWRGDPLDPAVASRLACDTDVYAIVFDQFGLPTGVGLTCRSATRAQRLVLRALYPTCPIDGVTPFAACDIHHVNVAFSDGGETELDNLVPISKPWHHRIHDQGWILTMDADRTLHLRRPDKTLERTIPPPQPITRHGP